MKTRLLTLIAIATTSCANLPYQTTSSKCLFPIDSAYLGGLINYSLDLDEIDSEEEFVTCIKYLKRLGPTSVHGERVPSL